MYLRLSVKLPRTIYLRQVSLVKRVTIRFHYFLVNEILIDSIATP